jgi:type IV pilus assembly protein PilB
LVEPQEKSLRVRYRVDGILRESREQPKSLQHAIISRIKVMANLNIAERRLPQDGRFMLKLRNREVDFRVSILPGSYGEKAALRILDKSTAMLDLDTLGFAEKSLTILKELSQRPHGMILVCGPTGCGKTTTLYSVLKFVDNPTKNIVTVEDPVEFQLRGISQVTIRPNIGLTFPSSLRSILRQDPDIIMVGEIRDFDTVDIAIKAALTGHLVLSTLHTTTASGSIVRLLNMGVEPFLISSSIILVAAQRLVRKICSHCKEPYKIDERMAKRLNLDPKKKTYRGKGCKDCLDTGYKGRTGLIEVLPLTTKVRELICRKAKEFEIKDAARKGGMTTLRENGLASVEQGLTTVEEIVRVTVGDQEVALK